MTFDTLTSSQSLAKYMPNSTLNASSWNPMLFTESSSALLDLPNSTHSTDLDHLSTAVPSAGTVNIFATIVTVVILFSIIASTVIGNILVCVAVCLVKKLRRPYNYLLVSLAVSDMCVAILVMPMALMHELLGKWQFGKVVCDVWVSVDVLSCTASILNLCMISVDRYYAITKPLEYGVKRTPTRMISYIVFVWISAAFVSVPPVLILGNEHGDGSICQVCQNFWYQIYATFISFYIPLSVMVTIYYKIFQTAKRIVDEEKKAQSHLKTIKANGRHSTKLKSKDAHISENNRRYSMVEINNGEIETKLMPEQILPVCNTTQQAWPSDSSNCLNQPNCPADGRDIDGKLPKHDFQNHLEVPITDSCYGNISPISTTTMCESSWSIGQAREEKLESVTRLTQGDVIPSYAFDEQVKNDVSCYDPRNQLRAKDSSKSLISQTDTNDVDSLGSDLPVMLEGYRPLSTAPKGSEIPSRTDGKDVGNQSDSSSQGLLSKGQQEEEDRRKSSVGSPRRKYLLAPKSKLRLTLAKERKASFTLGIIMSAFIICWLPFFVTALVRPFLTDQGAIPNIVSSLFLWLGYANSLLNPIIYATLNKDFRKPFQEILCFRCASLSLLMREEFYYSQYGDPDTPNHSHIRTSFPQRESWDPPPGGLKDTRNTKSPVPPIRKNTLSESRF